MMHNSPSPRFSVIIPVYNGASFISKALHSVFNQTFKPYEVIVCSDGSTDHTCNIVMKLFEECHGVQTLLIQQSHRGPGAARNSALKHATGDWIAFLDSDDVWEERKLEVVAGYINTYPESNFLCHSEIEIFLDGTERKLLYFQYHQPEVSLIKQLYKRNLFSTSAVVAARPLFRQEGGLFNESLMQGQDYELWLRLADRIKPKMIPEILGYYIQREDNITSFRWRRIKTSLTIANRYKGRVGYALWLHKNIGIGKYIIESTFFYQRPHRVGKSPSQVPRTNSRRLTIHAAPIPSLRSLWQALFAGLDSPSIEKVPGRSMRFYSLGRWAMAEGVAALFSKKGNKNGKVWIPDYFCNEALEPLRERGVELYFYPVGNDLAPDWDKLEYGTDQYSPPDVFVLVHYFGFPSCLNKAEVFCNKHGVELLEDCAHLLFPVNGYGRNTAVFSPRKILPLPEGGLLIIPDNVLGQQSPQMSTTNKRLILKWLFLRLGQRAMLSLGISWHGFRRINNSTVHRCCSDTASRNMEKLPDQYTLNLFGIMGNGLNQVVEKRRRNYTRLFQEISELRNTRPLFLMLPDDVCPYALPLIISDGRDAALRQLNRFGIPASSWPDLPAEVLQKSDEYKTAIWLQEHILLLPVHQDLSGKQVNYMASKLREILGKE